MKEPEWCEVLEPREAVFAVPYILVSWVVRGPADWRTSDPHCH
jgi:hypothetical protein